MTKRKLKSKSLRTTIRKEAQKILDRNSETKYETSSWREIDYGDNVAGAIDVQINEIGQGVGSAQRIGNQVKMQTLTGRFVATADANSTLSRMIIYKPRKANNSFTAQGAKPDVETALNYDNQIILYDSLKGHGKLNGLRFANFNFNIPLKGLQGVYDTSAGSSIQKNSLWMYLTSNQNTTNIPNITGHTRISYKDV